MKLPVQCLLIRAGGTVVDFPGASYHFRPENDPTGEGRHIAFITDKAHFARLISITEAYELVDDEPAAAPALTTQAPAVTTLQAVTPGPVVMAPPPDHPAPVEAGGVAMDPGPVTLQAPANASQAETKVESKALPTEAELEAMDLDQIRDQYQLETGKAASVAAKPPLLIARILGTRDEKTPA